MLNTHRHRVLVYLKVVTFTAKTPTPKLYPLFQHYPSPFSLFFCTATSDSRSFAVSYLIDNFGFSPESAAKAYCTHHVGFKTAENPEIVLKFFINRGFSNSQIHNMITKAPWLLSCDPSKRVLPKFEFLLSKGASSSDIVNLVSKNPNVLSPSLKNQIAPNYELVYRFLQSDKHTFACVLHNPTFFGDHRVALNIKVLLENGVTETNIARLLKIWCKVFCSRNMLKVVEELKELGFDPSKSTFSLALLAKKAVNETRWNKKVDAFKKWGWSNENVLEAFKRQPQCMLSSIDKINLVMSFWVNQLGWNALVLVKGPRIFGLSLERRIIPRASVLQFLLNNGLRKKTASLVSPFAIREELFLDNFIKRFKEESSDLLKLYEEKLNLASTTTRENTGMSSAKYVTLQP